jgi:hypothetical protein
MALYTFSIQMKVDVTGEGFDAMVEVIKQTARELSATAAFVNNQRFSPQIAVAVNDGFYGSDELDFMDTQKADEA